MEQKIFVIILAMGILVMASLFVKSLLNLIHMRAKHLIHNL